MSVLGNTFLTYGAVGNREDLADIIYEISPEDTPFMSSIGRATATATLFEWQTDALAAPNPANAYLQGDDITTFDAVNPTVRVGNRTQISRKTAIVSGTQEVVDKAGKGSEIAYQMTKKSKELKRDMETILIGNPQGAVTGTSAVPPQTASMLAWVKTNVDFGVGGVNPTWASGAPPLPRTDGTARTFTETILKNVLGLVWTNSGQQPSLLLVGPHNKGVVSGFAGIATRMRDVGSKQKAEIIGAADLYVGDFSTVSVVADRFQRERDAWVINPKMAAVAYLRPFQTEPLAKTGDAQKRLILVEYGLKVNAESAFGLAADLTTT